VAPSKTFRRVMVITESFVERRIDETIEVYGKASKNGRGCPLKH
jgi:hypothetical protein